MRGFKRTLLAAAITTAVAASGNAFAQFSNAYFFGDSLSDAGSFKPVLPPGTGQFTTNPGPVWTVPFANYYGFTTGPANQGGTDFAWGGARVTLLPGYPATPPTAAAVPVATQISSLMAKGPLDTNAIYSVQGGANDIFTQLGDYSAGKITATQLQANVQLAAGQLAQQAAILKTAGANYVMVWTLPDIGATPAFRGTPLSGQVTQITQLFNSTMLAGLDAANVNVVRLNAYGLLNEVLAKPSLYGFSNATGVACTTSSSLICTQNTLVAPDAAQTYVFADGVHPTTAMQAIEAQYAISVLNAPMQMGALGEAPLAVEQANWRTLDGRMVSGINGPRSQGKFDAWAAYDYGTPDYANGYLAGQGNVNTVAVGGDMKVSDKVLAGVMFNYSENKANSGGLDYTLREPMLTFYAGYGDGPWYAAATLGAGSLDYGTASKIALGAATRSESGSTKGWHFVGRLIGGYWFNAGSVLHGPTLKLTFQEARVRQFEENGSDSTTMTFGQQERKSFITSLGWQASGQLGAIRPFGRVSWEYEGQSDARSVTASVYGMGGTFSMPTYKPDNNWALFNLGAATEFGKVTGYLTGSATAGKGDGDSWALTVGLRMPL